MKFDQEDITVFDKLLTSIGNDRFQLRDNVDDSDEVCYDDDDDFSVIYEDNLNTLYSAGISRGEICRGEKDKIGTMTAFKRGDMVRDEVDHLGQRAAIKLNLNEIFHNVNLIIVHCHSLCANLASKLKIKDNKKLNFEQLKDEYHKVNAAVKKFTNCQEYLDDLFKPVQVYQESINEVKNPKKKEKKLM